MGALGAPLTLAAWLFLTIGIALGSWWAYYELGWGGFWFWDPVENASFMPWLISAALLHSAIVVEKREVLKSWTILLAILAFGFSLIGTFIVRSGVLTSVHAFANDPERGVFILSILVIFMGGALVLYALRAGVMEAKGVFGLASRETALVINNVLLAVSAFIVFVGTIWPLIAELFFDRKLSVGPPFFDAAFTPFIVALAVILPIGSIMPWKRARLKRTFRQLVPALVLTVLVIGLIWTMQTGMTLIGPIGVGLAVWLFVGAIIDLMTRAGRGAVSDRMRRLRRLPRADWGKAVAHMGFGITVFGISALLAWEVEDIRVVAIGETYDVGSYSLTLNEVRDDRGPNYNTTIADMSLSRDGVSIGALYPEKRVYPVAGMPTTEAAIQPVDPARRLCGDRRSAG